MSSMFRQDGAFVPKYLRSGDREDTEYLVDLSRAFSPGNNHYFLFLELNLNLFMII